MDENNEPPKVEFEGDNYNSFRQIPEDEENYLGRLVMKLGFAKDETKANYVLVIFVVISILVSLFIFVNKTGSSNVKTFPENTMNEPR